MNKNHQKTRTRKYKMIITCGIFFSTILIVLLGIKAFGKEVGEKVENTYILSTTTGASEGDNVLYIGIKYKDVSDTVRTEYVLMDQDLNVGYEIASKTGNLANDDQKQAKDNLDYKVKSYNTQIPFRMYSYNTFLFETPSSIKEIIELEVFTTGKGEWDCQDLRIYKVNTLHGINCIGSLSDDYFIEFDGNLVAEMQTKKEYYSFSWTNDRLFKIVSETKEDYSLNTNISDEQREYHSSEQSNYYMQLEFSDIYGAGIESFINYVGEDKRTISEMQLPEALYMRMRYLDIHGDTIELEVPVVLSSLLYLFDNGIQPDDQIAGYAQQGDLLTWELRLPNMTKVVESEIRYTADKSRGTNLGIEEIGTNTLREHRKTSIAKDTGDAIDILRLSIYEEANVVLKPSLSGAGIVIECSGQPFEEFHATAKEGVNIKPEKVEGFNLEPFTGNHTEALENQYMITIDTADNAQAGTVASLNIEFKYMSLEGKQVTTNVYSIKEYASDYYGYWPTKDEATFGKTAYVLGVSSGQSLKFNVHIEDVDYFTGAMISMEDNINDDWQMKGIKIEKVQEIDKRRVTWEDKIVDDMQTNRVYTREYAGESILNLKKDALIQKGNRKDISFVSQSVVDGAEDLWDETKYAMSYEEALQDFGFADTRITYEIIVNVEDEAVTESGNGDCGSENQFYFQLIFENGTSGYVLANQQLSADGFRTGYEEAFSISVNKDYGEVVGIRIIPEDIAEESDISDKLNINSIRINKTSNDAVNTQWIIEQVGWIEIAYKDEGATNSLLGLQGRTEAEIVRTFQVDYSAYSINLLFCLSTGVYQQGIQFEGELTADLDYFNGQGEKVTKSVDVVKEIARYANKQPNYEMVTDENGSMSKTTNSMSDPSYMFRGNHIDRFVVSLEDVTKLYSMTLKAKTKEGVVTTWDVKSLSASIITSNGGELTFNENDEYERSNDVQGVCIHTSTREPAYSVMLPEKTLEELNIYFTENNIEINGEEIGWESSISRNPTSKNDTLNLYVYMNEEAGDIKDYDMRAGIRYTNIFGATYQVSAESLLRNNDNQSFYFMGLNASNMAAMNQLFLEAEGGSETKAYVDHALIQRVRNGVVIENYRMDYLGTNVIYQTSRMPTTNIKEKSEQNILLQLNNNIQKQGLRPEDRDVAVAITYTSSISQEEKEYRSPYIYFTDQDINDIKSGQLIELKFNETYVKEITGIEVLSTGGIDLTIDRAIAMSYQINDSGEKIMEDYIGFGTMLKVSRTAQKMIPTVTEVTGSGAIIPIHFELKTAKAASDVESGTNSPIKMKLGYMSTSGESKEMIIQDIQMRIDSDGNFATDGTATLRLLVDDFKNARYIEFVPYDDNPDNQANWTLESMIVDINFGDTIERINRSVNQTINEEAPYIINLANIRLNAEVKTFNTANDTYTIKRTDSGECKILAENGQDIIITPSLTGSIKGYKVKVEKVSSAGATADADSIMRREGEQLILSPPVNLGVELVTYRVTLYSEEVESLRVEMDISLEPQVDPNTDNESI